MYWVWEYHDEDVVVDVCGKLFEFSVYDDDDDADFTCLAWLPTGGRVAGNGGGSKDVF